MEIESVSLNQRGKIKRGEAERLSKKYNINLKIVKNELQDYAAFKQADIEKCKLEDETATPKVLIVGNMSPLMQMAMLATLFQGETKSTRALLNYQPSSGMKPYRPRETKKCLLAKKAQQHYQNKKY